MEAFLLTLFSEIIPGAASFLAIVQFSYGVFRNRQNISEIKKKATEGDINIGSAEDYKHYFKPAYQVLEKSAPYAQRIIIALQLRAAMILILAFLVMFSILHGIAAFGMHETTNLVYSIFALIFFIFFVNKWIPSLSNVLNQAADKFQTNFPNGVEKRLFKLGIIPLSQPERLFMDSYLKTLLMVRSLESRYLKKEMDEQLIKLNNWLKNNE